MKKLVIALWLALAVLAGTVLAEEKLVCGDYEYRLLADGTAEITGYTGSEADLILPAELDGHAVTSIGDDAFRHYEFLTSISIPDSVTDIWDGAFSGCSSLTSITLPDSVTFIGEEAFASSTALTTIIIPDSVEYIEKLAFYNCPSLTLAVTPGSYAERYAKTNQIRYTQHLPEGSWLCTCGNVNNTKFCPECGQAQHPQCQNCGYKPDGATPNFCPDCGTKF